jgi:hypothetical protein
MAVSGLGAVLVTRIIGVRSNDRRLEFAQHNFDNLQVAPTVLHCHAWAFALGALL